MTPEEKAKEAMKLKKLFPFEESWQEKERKRLHRLIRILARHQKELLDEIFELK